ncbi:MAG: cytochrome c oxidase subunit I [Actinobacteria bacterium]|nr:cytochrome c oxidase subunit I [Actinomycetota bacterium]
MTVLAERTADLDKAWTSPPGLLGFATAVNHKQIGLRFIVTSFVFLLIGGLQAMLIRTQLMRPESAFLDAEAYNQLFTMHGTTMMFLFAVPMIEGLAMYLVPLMIGTRDLPFPRLNAFGYWCFVFGGLLLYSSFLTGSVPDGGWFAYTPLTGPEYSPGPGLDFWLLGVTLVEVSGIVGALELVVVILRQRAPGMSLMRMPLFVWSILVTGLMMLVAFPAVIAASLLLELERKLGLPFYAPSSGGNPLLWQHLFWVFGHPEVYIMLLPATGIVSAVVAVNTRRAIVAYDLVVASLVAIGIISFGLWVHHMFAVGIPVLAQILFAVASSTIAIPSGIQVFAWLATIRRGRPRWTTPMLYVVGFIVTFVAGGITGVMVAAAPFDWQVHDTFFIVAHFHYVLIGGVLFPIFAGLHHWFPKMTGRVPSEALGRLSFALVFTGFHIAFFPQHILGLLGMPRRVYTYDAEAGWSGYNGVSTAGSYLLGLGVLVFGWNLLHHWRRGQAASPDPWSGDTLEWATSSPPASYNFPDIPTVSGREPLWDPPARSDSEPANEVPALTWARDGQREQLHTTMAAAEVDRVFTVPGPLWWPLATAGALTLALVGTLTDQNLIAGVGAVLTVVAGLRWTSPPGGWRVPRDQLTPANPAISRPAGWHGLLFGLIACAGTAAAFVYAYFYLRLTAGAWPPAGVDAPAYGLLAATTVATVATTGAIAIAGSLRARPTGPLTVGMVLAVAALVTGALDASRLPFSPTDHAYGAVAITLRGFNLVGLTAGAIVLAVALRAAMRRPGDSWAASVRSVTLLLWIFVAGSAVVISAVLALTPSVEPGDRGGRPPATHHSADVPDVDAALVTPQPFVGTIR